MAAPMELFRFDQSGQTNSSDNNNNKIKYSQISFDVEADSILHGFAEYLEARLYKETKISNLPETFTPGMFSVTPVFIPVVKYLHLKKHDKLKVHIWRKVSKDKVW